MFSSRLTIGTSLSRIGRRGLTVAAALGAMVSCWSALGQAPPGPGPGPGQPDQPRQERERREFRGPGQGGPMQFGERREGRGGGGFGPGGIPGVTDILEPDFLRRDVRLFVDHLQLDDMQRFVVETLLEDYDTEFTAGAEATREKFIELSRGLMQGMRGRIAANEPQREQMRQQFRALRDEMEKLRAQGGPQADPEQLRQMFRQRAEALRLEYERQAGAIMPNVTDAVKPILDQLAEPLNQWQATKIEMRRQLLIDVQTQLTDEQAARWPTFERVLRRLKTVDDGMLSGESLDLHVVVRDLTTRQPRPEVMDPLQAEFEGALNIDASLIDAQAVQAAAEPILAEYDTALDAALIARNDVLERSQRDLLDAMRASDAARITGVLQRQMTLRAAVRDVNLLYADKLAEALPRSASGPFKALVNDRAFGRVMRSTPAQRMMAAAVKIEGLDPATVSSLTAMHQRLNDEVAIANERLIQLTRANESQQAIQRVQRMMAWVTGAPPTADQGEDPVRAEYEKRNEISQRYQQQLESMLTKEQYESISRGGRGQNRRERGGDGDGPPRQFREGGRDRNAPPPAN